jgi:hypothetical protein
MDPNSARRLPSFLVSVAVGLLVAPAAVLFGADSAEQKATVKINPVRFVSARNSLGSDLWLTEP